MDFYFYRQYEAYRHPRGQTGNENRYGLYQLFSSYDREGSSQDPEVGAGDPDLHVRGVPAEADDVLAQREVGRHLHPVHPGHSDMVSTLL